MVSYSSLTIRARTLATTSRIFRTSKKVKLVIFAPETHAEIVRKALGEAGAGKIGLYDYCSFTVIGTAAFRPLTGSRSKSGTIGHIEEVNEARIETVCHVSLVKKVIQAVRKVHPYDEMGYDIYPLLEFKKT